MFLKANLSPKCVAPSETSNLFTGLYAEVTQSKQESRVDSAVAMGEKAAFVDKCSF